MKKTALAWLSLALITFSLAALSAAVPDDPPSAPPEFYFTRLRYTENGMRGRGIFGFGFGGPSATMPKPGPFTCPEFGGRNFFPRQGYGWAIDYPGADCKFMGGIHRLTGLNVSPNPHVVDIMDPDLFDYPFLYIVEPGGLGFSQGEAARLREYFLRGGFVHVDDYWGLRQKGNFDSQIRKVFPDRPMEVLPLSHEIFHTFFDIDTILQVPGQGDGCYGGQTWQQADDTEPRIYGISDDKGRVMVVMTYNQDLGDAWEYMDLACYPEKYSGQSYRLGLNFMIYAMTH